MKKLINKGFAAVLLAATIIPSTNAWIIVLNGTSSAGKTTVARELQKITEQQTEILQLDTEVIQVFKERLESIGHRHDGVTNFWAWFETLPEDVKKIEVDATCYDEANKRMFKKTKKLDDAKINVIIDTLVDREEEYN